MHYLNKNSKGFTLVEILVVMVIMGLVITSVYSLFISSKRTSTTSEEVVDVQQNLRVAMETLVADIRMAGFLIPHGGTAITSAPDLFGIDANRDGDLVDTSDSGGFFTLQTCSPAKAYARVLGEEFSTPNVKLQVETDMVGLFKDEDKVRVIRPATMVDVSGEWEIDGIVETNKIQIDNSSYTPGTIEAGDMVVRVIGGEGAPATVNYYLRPTEDAGTNNFELVRQDAAGRSVVANYISSIDLTYLLADGYEVATTTDLSEIKAVRVVIGAETDNTKTGSANYSGVKQRSLQTLVKIRNAMGG